MRKRLRKVHSMIKHIEKLKLLSRGELLVKWLNVFGTPAPGHLNKPYLLKHLAWKLEFDCLPSNVQKQIDKLVEQYAKTRSLKPSEIKRIAKFEVTQGTRFIREFKGEKHEVTALEKGFNYNNKMYKSLSAIANEITGTRWNGKKFFGVAS